MLEYGKEHSRGTRKGCSVQTSGPSTSWFSLCYTRPHGEEDPRLLRLWLCLSCYRPVVGHAGRPAWLVASSASQRPGPHDHPSCSPTASKLDPLWRERFEGQTLG